MFVAITEAARGRPAESGDRTRRAMVSQCGSPEDLFFVAHPFGTALILTGRMARIGRSHSEKQG